MPNKQQEARVLCEDLLIKVRHNKEKAGGGLRQERGRRLTLSWRGETVGMLLLRGKEESGEAARSQRGSVQIDHVHISQLDADGGIRLLNAKCNSAALTGLIHIQKCHAVVGLLVQDK